MKDTWNPYFLSTSHRFEALASLEISFEDHGAWPSLDTYNNIMESYQVRNIHHQKLTCVAAKPRPRRRRAPSSSTSLPPAWVELPLNQRQPASLCQEPTDLPYEMQILTLGVLPTRLENWHDFCNMLTWCRFPQTKAVLNALQARPHGVLRNRYQELLTLFDEGGVIRIFPDLIPPEGTYPATPPRISFYFGHALLEADLCGFKNSDGFTFPVYLDDKTFQNLSSSPSLYSWIDEHVSQHISSGKLMKLTRQPS